MGCWWCICQVFLGGIFVTDTFLLRVMAWIEGRNGYDQLCNTVSGLLPAYKVSGIDWYYVTLYVLYRGLHIYSMVNLFMFLGNWDILTLLVIADIFFFIIVTLGRLQVMYGVMFLLVLDLVVCIYVIYL